MIEIQLKTGKLYHYALPLRQVLANMNDPSKDMERYYSIEDIQIIRVK